MVTVYEFYVGYMKEKATFIQTLLATQYTPRFGFVYI